MGPEFARKRATIFLVLTLFFLAIGVGVTVTIFKEIFYFMSSLCMMCFCFVFLQWGTYQIAASKGGMYVVYVGTDIKMLQLSPLSKQNLTRA